MNPALIALIGALGGVLAAAVPVWITSRRHPSRKAADGTSIVEAAEGVVGLLRTELNRLSKDQKELRAELAKEQRRTDELAQKVGGMERLLAEYRRGVGLLIGQIDSLGHRPAWHPSQHEDPPAGTPI